MATLELIIIEQGLTLRLVRSVRSLEEAGRLMMQMALVKILWTHQTEREVPCELEEYYPKL
jgi:hypothetical protein